MRVFVYEHVSAGGLGPGAPASLLREGRAMLDAVAGDFARVPGVEEVWAPAHPISEAGFVHGASLSHCTLIIAPEFDGIHAERCRTAELWAGSRLLGSAPNAITFTADKFAVYQHWQARGVPTPHTMLADAWTPRPVPGVCKPRHGAGSQATFLVRTADEWPSVLRQARREWPRHDLLAQAYAPGMAASVAFLVGPRQTLPLLPAAQRLSSDGRFRYGGGRVPLPEEYRTRAIDLGLRALTGIDGLRGYVGVDLVLSDAGDYAIEINPRVTTSYVGLRKLCRWNLAQVWLDLLAEKDCMPLTWRNRTIEFDPYGTCR